MNTNDDAIEKADLDFMADCTLEMLQELGGRICDHCSDDSDMVNPQRVAQFVVAVSNQMLLIGVSKMVHLNQEQVLDLQTNIAQLITLYSREAGHELLPTLVSHSGDGHGVTARTAPCHPSDSGPAAG